MFELDYKSRLPIYEQLYRSITRMAALGAVDPGEALPSVRSLAQELGVNPNTVQKAYQMLERDGIICSVPGKGSFVAGDDSAARRRKALAAQKVKDTLTEAMLCGVTEAEALSQVSAVYGGREEKHD